MVVAFDDGGGETGSFDNSGDESGMGTGGGGSAVAAKIAAFKAEFAAALAAGGDTGAIIKALNDYLASPEAQKYAETNPEFAQAAGNLRAHSSGGNAGQLAGDISDLAGSVADNANTNKGTNTNNSGTQNNTVSSPKTGGSPAVNSGNTDKDSDQSTQFVQFSNGLTPCAGSGCARREDSVSSNNIPTVGDVLGLGIIGAGNDANASASQNYFPPPVYTGSGALDDNDSAQLEPAKPRTDIAANQTSIDLQVSAPGADSVYLPRLC
ncbi:MAG: hypothetical protein WBC48_00425 [Minisyncoccales bacterium]